MAPTTPTSGPKTSPASTVVMDDTFGCGEHLSPHAVKDPHQARIDAMLDNSSHLVFDACTQQPLLLISTLPQLLNQDNNNEFGELMHQREREYIADSSYMRHQNHLDKGMRAILIDWMQEVGMEFSLARESIYLAVNYVDRYLSRVYDVPQAQLQLIGATCLLVASKFEEIHPPKALDFAVTTDGLYTAAAIHEKEAEVLDVLEWRLLPQTSYAFVKLYLKSLAKHFDRKKRIIANQQERDRMQYCIHLVTAVTSFHSYMSLLDLSLLDYRSLQFNPSALSAAAISVVFPSMAHDVCFVSGYEKEYLTPAIEFLERFSGVESAAELVHQETHVELKIPLEDMYSRQNHNRHALPFFRRLMRQEAASVATFINSADEPHDKSSQPAIQDTSLPPPSRSGNEQLAAQPPAEAAVTIDSSTKRKPAKRKRPAPSMIEVTPPTQSAPQAPPADASPSAELPVIEVPVPAPTRPSRRKRRRPTPAEEESDAPIKPPVAAASTPTRKRRREAATHGGGRKKAQSTKSRVLPRRQASSRAKKAVQAATRSSSRANGVGV